MDHSVVPHLSPLPTSHGHFPVHLDTRCRFLVNKCVYTSLTQGMQHRLSAGVSENILSVSQLLYFPSPDLESGSNLAFHTKLHLSLEAIHAQELVWRCCVLQPRKQLRYFSRLIRGFGATGQSSTSPTPWHAHGIHHDAAQSARRFCCEFGASDAQSHSGPLVTGPHHKCTAALQHSGHKLWYSVHTTVCAECMVLMFEC